MRPPSGDIQRTIDDIYRILKELKDAVNKPSAKGSTATDVPGKSGDIRVVKGDAGQVHLEVKTDEGWSRTKLDTFEKASKGA